MNLAYTPLVLVGGLILLGIVYRKQRKDGSLTADKTKMFLLAAASALAIVIISILIFVGYILWSYETHGAP